MRHKELFAFIKERHAIYQRRVAGKPKPWTKDPILQQYRFCNVYRELDTVTQWIAQNWRAPHQDDPNLWFAMVIARLVNWPETLAIMECPRPRKWRDQFTGTIHQRQQAGQKAFSSAYIVSTNGRTMDKAEYLEQYVLSPLWDARNKLQPVEGESLHQYWSKLRAFNGMGSFMAAQVVADLKYVHPLQEAVDWWTWAAPGPGSKRGLNRVYGYAPDDSWTDANWHEGLMDLKVQIDPLVAKAGMPLVHAQDLQNCLCEFDKYERVRLGEGRPRSLYPGV
jgi:hypothetical protein